MVGDWSLSPDLFSISVTYPYQDTCAGKEDFFLKELSGEDTIPHVALPSLSYSKKFSVPDISDISEDFTNAKSEILNELFDVAILCFLISHGKYYSSIESVAIRPWY